MSNIEDEIKSLMQSDENESGDMNMDCYYKYTVIFANTDEEAIEADYLKANGVIFKESYIEAVKAICDYYGEKYINDLHIEAMDSLIFESDVTGVSYDYKTGEYTEVKQ